MFVTMVSGVYDPRNGVVRLANAGHEPALLAATDGTFTALPAEAPPLGIVADASVGDFPEAELRLDGGALYVVSDGVTEGRLPSGEPLGQEGLVRLLGAHAGEAATATPRRRGEGPRAGRAARRRDAPRDRRHAR